MTEADSKLAGNLAVASPHIWSSELVIHWSLR